MHGLRIRLTDVDKDRLFVSGALSMFCARTSLSPPRQPVADFWCFPLFMATP